MLKNTCYEGQICKYDTPLEASAQGLLIEAYQHTQTKPNQCSISTFLTSKNIFIFCGYAKFQLIGWEGIIVQEGMIRQEGMIGVKAEMQLGTILVIYVINNLLAGTLYTHIKGAHEGLKYYCNYCDKNNTNKSCS